MSGMALQGSAGGVFGWFGWGMVRYLQKMGIRPGSLIHGAPLPKWIGCMGLGIFGRGYLQTLRGKWLRGIW